MTVCQQWMAWVKAFYGPHCPHTYTVRIPKDVFDEMDEELWNAQRFVSVRKKPYALCLRNVRFVPK